MSTLDLIKAIASGSATATEQTFNHCMAEKVSANLDGMRQEIARTMFNTVVEESIEEDTTGWITEEEYQALSDEEKAEFEPINEAELDEGRMAELDYDMRTLSHDDFHKRYGHPKSKFAPAASTKKKRADGSHSVGKVKGTS